LQADLDRRIGLSVWPAPGPVVRGGPLVNNSFIKPDRNIATAAKALIVVPPVGHPEPGLRDLVAAGGMNFIRHSKRFIGKEQGEL